MYSCCLSGGQWCTAVVYRVGSGVQLLKVYRALPCHVGTKPTVYNAALYACIFIRIL